MVALGSRFSAPGCSHASHGDDCAPSGLQFQWSHFMTIGERAGGGAELACSNGCAPTFRPLPTPEPVCWHFSNKNTCAHGAKCRFSHATPQTARRPSASISCRGTASEELLFWMYRTPPNASEVALLVDTLEAHGFRRAQTPEEEARAILLWSGSSSIPRATRLNGYDLHRGMLVNRLGCGRLISQKDLLVSSLRKRGLASLAPLTFKVPEELPQLLEHHRRISVFDVDGVHQLADDGRRLCAAGPLTWIVKPLASGCGRGIHLTQDVETLRMQSPLDKCVVSAYVSNPLLVDGRKLDLRLFVLVLAGTPTRPRKAFLYRHGLVRFAAKAFGLEDLCHAAEADAKKRGWDPEVHLTYIDSYDQHRHRRQRARSWTVQQLRDWLSDRPEYGRHRADDFWRDIGQLVVRTLDCLPLPARPCVSPTGAVSGAGGRTEFPVERSNAFEVFGFDVLPDSALRPWSETIDNPPHCLV